MILLSRFAGEHDPRKHFRQPFLIGKYAAATNCHWICFRPRRKGDKYVRLSGRVARRINETMELMSRGYIICRSCQIEAGHGAPGSPVNVGGELFATRYINGLAHEGLQTVDVCGYGDSNPYMRATDGDSIIVLMALQR